MRYLKIKTVVLATPVVILGLFLVANCATGQKVSPPSTDVTPSIPAGDVAGVQPGPNDPRIAYVTARLLEQIHYTQRPLDTELSKRFFDGYIDSLDSRHENFLQSDLSEFSFFRTNLDALTTGTGGTANLTPAFSIFHRYLERLHQHDEYVLDLLKKNHLKFNTDERIAIERRHEPYPKDMAEAQKLWEQQLKFEYLQEKLSKELTNVNDSIVVKASLPPDVTAGIIDTLTHHYQWNLHIFTNYDSTDVLQLYLEALTHAYDPHSDYFNPEHANDFAITMNLSLFGIGAQLVEDDGYCTISKLIVGGPADKSKKLREKDRIVAVAQGTNPPVNVVDMELGKVVQMIRGPKASEVRLTVSPDSDRADRKVIALMRDEIKLDDQAARAKLIEMPDGKGGRTRIGVVALPSFYAPVGGLSTDDGDAAPKFTSVDVAKLVTKLKQENVNGIILDIRSNPGGSLEEAVKFTGLFIKDGPVVLARSPEGPVSVDSDNDPSILYGGPLAVMINRYSASASEIAAAALQDYGRALIVGDSSSFGKGTVQSLTPLRQYVWPATPTATNDPGVVKITIRKFYRISGGSTQFKGVVPDIILPDPLDYQSEIESEATLDNPLPWDTINSATYTNFNMVQPFAPILSKKSTARVATNQDFTYIRQDIAEMQKMQTDKSITLNEHEAIKERQDNQTRQKARDAERNSRAPEDIKVYDISLADAAKPGLPAPVYYPGILETNYSDLSTITLKTGRAGSGSGVASSDKTIAEILGLNLATGTFTNRTLSVASLSAADKRLLEREGVDKSSLTSTNLAYVDKLAFTNSMVTFQIATVKPKNQADLDPLLQETDKIMLDYISLLAQNGSLTKN